MNLRKSIVLLILVMLMLLPVAWVAASETAVSHNSRTFNQTAVLAILNQFAEPDCSAAEEAPHPPDFDMTQPVPDCWLLTGTK